MGKLFIAVFAALFMAIRNLTFVGFAVGIGTLIARLICNIHAQENYSWFSGVWHGLFFIPNYVRNLIDSDILYKALEYSTMYNVFWWIVVIFFQAPLIYFLLVKIVIEPIMVGIVAANEH